MKINTTLTTYARGMTQDLSKSLASFFAPTVVVGTTSGQYKVFSDKNNFQVPDTRRAIGGIAKRIEMEETDAFFNCQPHALEAAIDDHSKKQAGAAGLPMLKKSKVRTVVSGAKLSFEARVLATISAAVSAESGLGVWGGSTATADPVAELDALIEEMATQTGAMPNRLGIGLPAWTKIRSNPQVLKRFPGAQSVGVTIEQFKSLLLNSAIDIRVGILAKDTAKLGKSKSAANIIGSELYLFYAEDNPTEYDMSFCKTFRTEASAIESVYEYRDDTSRSDIIATDWTEDMKVTAAVCGKRITVTNKT